MEIGNIHIFGISIVFNYPYNLSQSLLWIIEFTVYTLIQVKNVEHCWARNNARRK